jgi:hypothetical protein
MSRNSHIAGQPVITQLIAEVFAEHVIVRIVPSTFDRRLTNPLKFGPLKIKVEVMVWSVSRTASQPDCQPVEWTVPEVAPKSVLDDAASSVALLPPIAQFCPVAVTP